ncbi:MAG: TM2 domain-containing protein [Clostridiales bacterium]|nr:TM2 domain-containing protein [Clostridiales bacterium]
MDKKVRIIIVIFLGVFGVHKFIDKEYKMGLIYLLSGGLFGIGWIIDVFREIIGTNKSKSLMTKEALNIINEGKLPNIIATNLNLSEDEICHYMEKGYTFKEKTITTGYTGKSSGVSIKVMDGLTYRTGGSGSKAIRETQRTTYTGILYITNKRVIYTSTNECFDKTFDKITSITEAKDGVILQIGSSSYSIIIETPAEFVKVFNIAKQNKL